MNNSLIDFKNRAVENIKIGFKIIGFCLVLVVIRILAIDFKPCDFGYSGPAKCVDQRHQEVEEAEMKLKKAKELEFKEILAESHEEEK